MPDNTVRITGICLLTAVAVNVYTGRNKLKLIISIEGRIEKVLFLYDLFFCIVIRHQKLLENIRALDEIPVAI